MTARDWATMGATFCLAALIVLVVGLPVVARYMPDGVIHQRNARAGRAIYPMAGLLFALGMFAISEPKGIVRALFSAAGIALWSFVGLLRNCNHSSDEAVLKVSP